MNEKIKKFNEPKNLVSRSFCTKACQPNGGKTEINVIEKQLGRYIFRWPGEI